MKLQRNSLIGAFALCSMVGLGHAASAQTAVGVIDEAELGQKYKKYKDAMDANEKRADAVEGKLSARELLTEAEGKQFDEIIKKKTPSAPETATLNKLVTAGTTRRAEYMGLVGQATRTNEQTNRMKALEADAKRNAPALQKLMDAIFADLKKEREQIEKENLDRASKVIEQVASDKKLTLVISKRFAIWNAPALEITDLVLDRLNKG
ncbi:MAG TPA: OmpH family outer membrane protein [Abditibacteriaceae bacterium]|nr:OmpH family outer membrane protein [Abditibacteriaceae bacterium]